MPFTVPLIIEAADKTVEKINISLLNAVGLDVSKYLNCQSPLKFINIQLKKMINSLRKGLHQLLKFFTTNVEYIYT